MGLTSQEIKRWARGVNMDKEFHGKRVFIKNAEGKYLGRMTLDGPTVFLDTRAHAYVYRYTEDRVLEQLQQVEEMHGAIWTPEEYAPPASMEGT